MPPTLLLPKAAAQCAKPIATMLPALASTMRGKSACKLTRVVSRFAAISVLHWASAPVSNKRFPPFQAPATSNRTRDRRVTQCGRPRLS